MRAAIYLRVSTLEQAQNFLDDYKDRAVEYCRDKGYDLLAVIEVVGSKDAMKHFGHRQLKKIVQNRMIDVLVIPHLHMISRSIPDIIQMLDYLWEFGVKAECMRCDPMEYTILQMYRDTTEIPEERRNNSAVSIEDLLIRIAKGRAI